MLGYISRPEATFTIGLVVFASMLMLHNGIAVYGYIAMAELYSDDLLHILPGYISRSLWA